MSTVEIGKDEINEISNIFSQRYTHHLEIQKYKYAERKYFEIDFDLIDFNFTRDSIYKEINELILVYEEIFKAVTPKIEIIAANDDTETEILKYEEDRNNIESFGLFVTNRAIPNIKPYYSSNICNVYLNFEFVSFGVMY